MNETRQPRDPPNPDGRTQPTDAAPGRGDRGRGRDNAGLSRNLGRMFAHIKHGFTQPVGQRPRTEVGRRTEEERRDTPRGPVTLRRTIIEEVEFDSDQADPR